MRWRFGRYGTAMLLWACAAAAMEVAAEEGSKYDTIGPTRLVVMAVMLALAFAIVYTLFVDRDE